MLSVVRISRQSMSDSGVHYSIELLAEYEAWSVATNLCQQVLVAFKLYFRPCSMWILEFWSLVVFLHSRLTKRIDSFVEKVWRNFRGQYQFKTAEVTSDLNAAMFFGGIDLYSDHWVTSRILALAGLSGTRFGLLNKIDYGELLQSLSSIESSPGCDLLHVLNGRYTCFRCELSPRSETIKSQCYTHIQYVTGCQTRPSPNGCNTNPRRRDAPTKQRYSKRLLSRELCRIVDHTSGGLCYSAALLAHLVVSDLYYSHWATGEFDNQSRNVIYWIWV